MIWQFTLSYRVLERSGILAPAGADANVYTQIDGQRILLRKLSRDSYAIEWSREPYKYLSQFTVETVKARFGDKHYLVCPCSYQRCLKLYARDGILAAKEFHQDDFTSREREQARVDDLLRLLVGHDGQGPVRGERRRKALSGLALVKDPDLLPSEAKALLQNEAVRQRRAGKRPHRLSQGATPNSTRMALQDLSGQTVQGLLPPNWQDVLAAARPTPRPRISPERPIADLTRHAILDIGALARWWKLKTGDCKVACLNFPVAFCGTTRLLFVAVDTREGRDPRLVIRCDEGSGTPAYDQVVALCQPPRPNRWMMICPMTGERTTKLYLRDGMFGSRDAQRLRHPSQMRAQPRPGRAFDKARTIAAQALAAQPPSFSLTYRDLEDSGLFAIDRDHAFITFQHGEWELQACWTAHQTAIRVEWREGGRLRGCNVRLDQRWQSDKTAKLLICPRTRKAVPVLEMRDNVLASPTFHAGRRPKLDRMLLRCVFLLRRLEGLDGKPAARGLIRQRFLRELADMPAGAPKLVTDYVLAFSDEAFPLPTPLRSNQHFTVHSSLEALDMTLSLRAQQRLRKALLPVLANAPGPTPIVLPDRRPQARLSEHGVLDMRTLGRFWDLRPGDLKVARLSYPETVRGGAQRVDVAVDVRQGHEARLLVRLHRRGAKGPTDQIIRLSRSSPMAPLRWFLHCPITGKPADMLFLRDDVFASRPVHRLRYESQLKPVSGLPEKFSRETMRLLAARYSSRPVRDDLKA